MNHSTFNASGSPPEPLCGAAGEMGGAGSVPLDALPVSTILLDGEGVVTGWNAAAERLFGWQRAETLGLPLPLVLQRRGEGAEPIDVIGACARGAAGLDAVEAVVRKRDGTSICVSVSAAPLGAGAALSLTEISAYRWSVGSLEKAVPAVQDALSRNPGLCFLIDPDGTLRAHTAGEPADLRLPGSAVRGRRLYDLLPDIVADAVHAAVREVAAAGRPACIEVPVPGDDGERCFEARMRRDAEGLVVAEVRDTTEARRAAQALRRAHEQAMAHVRERTAALEAANEALRREAAQRGQAEDALRRSEELYRTLAEAAQDLIYVVGRDDRVEYVNASGARQYGCKPEDLVGRLHTSLFSPDVAAQHAEKLARVFATGQPSFVEDHVPFPTGEAWLHTSFVPLREADGSVRAILGISRDITIRKRMEEALRESEERYRSLAEAAHDFIFIVDQDDRIQYMNTYAARAVGGRPEDLVGTPRSALFSTEISERQRGNLGAAMATGEPVYHEGISNLGGRELWLSTWLVPLRAPDGVPRSVLGISRDITERKRLEEDARQAKARLETIVAHIPAGVAYLDRDLRHVALNPALARINHLPLEQHLGRRPDELLADGERIASALLEVARTGQPVALRDELRVYPGPRAPIQRFFDVDILPTHDDQGEVEGFLVLVVERTHAVQARHERERVFASQGQQQRLLDAILDNIPACVAYLDSDLNLVHANAGIARLAGRPVDELVGRMLFDVLPLAPARRLFEAAVGTGEGGLLRDVPIGPEGAACDCWVRPIHDAAGRPEGLVLCLVETGGR